MTTTLLANIRIILVEPAGPLNVGSVARIMKNMGLSHLVLVNPHCDYLGQEARQMAVHAADVLEKAQVAETLPEGLRGCHKAIATTGRSRTPETTLENPKDALPWLLQGATWADVPTHANEPDRAALIFGPEDRGLNNEELNQAHRFVYIPSNPEYPSLNLAQAVGICCYELYQQSVGRRAEGGGWRTETEEAGEVGKNSISNLQSTIQNLKSSSPHLPISPHPTATLDQLEAFYHHLKSLLLNIGYLYPHTADSRMRKFRRLFSRSLLSGDEVAMLRGLLSQMEWAIVHRRNPSPEEFQKTPKSDEMER